MTYLSEYFGALEADFQRVYQLDLRRVLWTDRVSVRRLWGLIEGLPAGSAFMSALAAAPVSVPVVPPSAGSTRDAIREFFGKG